MGCQKGTEMQKILVWSLIGSVALVGCGGGGSASDTNTPVATPSAQGLWNGNTSTNRAVTGLVLGDGSYYVLYSAPGNPLQIAGVVQGSGSSAANIFSSSDARDFNFEGFGVLPAAFSVTFSTKQSFNGSVAYSGGTRTSFTSTYDTSYESTPSVTSLAGNFTGQVTSSAGTQSATVSISPTGAISGGSAGCVTSGSVTARTDGNAYNLSLAFGPSPCVFASQTLTGVAYFNSATKRLFAVTPNAGRNDGVLFVGTKP